jgi:predicted lactoylglutathione lyase
MTEENRAENFLYWAHFRDSGGRRWEATYDPEKRVMDYTLLSR